MPLSRHISGSPYPNSIVSLNTFFTLWSKCSHILYFSCAYCLIPEQSFNKNWNKGNEGLLYIINHKTKKHTPSMVSTFCAFVCRVIYLNSFSAWHMQECMPEDLPSRRHTEQTHRDTQANSYTGPPKHLQTLSRKIWLHARHYFYI